MMIMMIWTVRLSIRPKATWYTVFLTTLKFPRDCQQNSFFTRNKHLREALWCFRETAFVFVGMWVCVCVLTSRDSHLNISVCVCLSSFQTHFICVISVLFSFYNLPFFLISHLLDTVFFLIVEIRNQCFFLPPILYCFCSSSALQHECYLAWNIMGDTSA